MLNVVHTLLPFFVCLLDQYCSIVCSWLEDSTALLREFSVGFRRRQKLSLFLQLLSSHGS